MSGIPESLHLKFQEEEEEETAADARSDEQFISSYKSTMLEMPTKNNESGPGFNEEVLDLLNDWGLNAVIPCFRQHSISLYRFLTMKDPDLKTMGVHFTSDRKDILDVIKRFHLCRWQTLNTFVMKPKKVCFTALDGLDIMSRLTQHFYIECATLAYLRSRFEDVMKRLSTKEKTAFLEALEPNLTQAQNMIETLKTQTKKVVEELREKTRFEDEYPADFIGPKQQARWRKKYLAITTASVLIVLYIAQNKVKDFPSIPFAWKTIP